MPTVHAKMYSFAITNKSSTCVFVCAKNGIIVQNTQTWKSKIKFYEIGEEKSWLKEKLKK